MGNNMLSKIDIENEINKEINIVPFNPENIKEASLNVTASNYAWTYNKERSENAVINGEIILKANKTTLVYTEEIIGIGSKIGGTVHSKVSMAAKGIGHISTTFGPCYCGRFIIPLHNFTNQDITIKVGDTFATLVFFYVKSKKITQNHTDPGHGNRLGEWNIHTNEIDKINPEWSYELKTIKEQLQFDTKYVEFDKKRKHSLIILRKIKNVFILCLPLLFILCMQFFIKPKNFDTIHYLCLYFIAIPNLLLSFFNR